jgi:serine/threonine protein kinase
MAPEVMASRPRNSKSDVYSLGCVFFELIFALELKTDVVVTSFSSEMPGIHDRVSKLMPDHIVRTDIASRAIEMTGFNPLDRPSSASLVLSLCGIQTYGCQQCHRPPLTGSDTDTPVVESSPTDEPSPGWIWSEHYKRYYRTTRDATGKYIHDSVGYNHR